MQRRKTVVPGGVLGFSPWQESFVVAIASHAIAGDESADRDGSSMRVEDRSCDVRYHQPRPKPKVTGARTKICRTICTVPNSNTATDNRTCQRPIGLTSASPPFDPRSQHDLERPGRPMLAMQLQVGLRNAVRVGHIVVYGHSSPSVRAGTVFPRPADRGVNRHICNVDALRHQFPCHALCEPDLA